jgi:hypothetical protein
VLLDYCCYFFGPITTSSFGASSSIDGVENFCAETDQNARMKAETMYRQRCNHVHGFELWQANRLVHRESASLGEHDPTS